MAPMFIGIITDMLKQNFKDREPAFTVHKTRNARVEDGAFCKGPTKGSNQSNQESLKQDERFPARWFGHTREQR